MFDYYHLWNNYVRLYISFWLCKNSCPSLNQAKQAQMAAYLAADIRSHSHKNDGNNDDFSPYNMLLTIKNSWPTAAACTLAGLLLGSAYALFTPGKFHASANIQMATVANLPVELPATLGEKMKLPLFYSEQVYADCGLNESRAPGEDLVGILQPTVNRAAPMINISFEGESAAEAQRCLSAVLSYIRDSQAALAAPIINANKVQLAELKERFAEAKKLNSELSAQSAELRSNNTNAAAAGIMLSTLSTIKQELKELSTEIGKLEIAISTTQTRQTELATPIYVKDVRTRFKRLLYAVSGALAGLFLGVAFILTFAAWRNTRPKPSTSTHS